MESHGLPNIKFLCRTVKFFTGSTSPKLLQEQAKTKQTEHQLGINHVQCVMQKPKLVSQIQTVMYLILQIRFTLQIIFWIS